MTATSFELHSVPSFLSPFSSSFLPLFLSVSLFPFPLPSSLPSFLPSFHSIPPALTAVLFHEVCCYLSLNMLSSTSTQAGLQLTLDNIVENTKVLSVQINDKSYISNPYRINELRPVEQAYYTTSSDGVRTTVIYDNLSVSQAEARFSMYTTLFVTFLLVVSTTSMW